MESWEGLGRVGRERRAEYLAWRDEFLEREPKIRSFLRPPSREATEKIWELLAPFLDGASAQTWLCSELAEGSERVVELWGQQAFVVALDRCVQIARGPRSLPFNKFVEALAGRFSLVYHQSPVRAVYEMPEDIVRKLYSEFGRMGLRPDKLWGFLKKWSPEDGKNPLFWLKDYKMAASAVYERTGSEELRHFEQIIAADGAYRRVRPPGARVLQDTDPTPNRREKVSHAAGVPFKVVENGKAGRRVLKLQEQARLLFDSVTFRHDYAAIERRLEAQAAHIRATYGGMNPTLPSAEGWFKANPKDYKEAEGKERLRLFRVRGDRIDRKRRSPRARELACLAIGEGLLSGDYLGISEAEAKEMVEGKEEKISETTPKGRKKSAERLEKERKLNARWRRMRRERWQRATKDYARWREEEAEHLKYPPETNIRNIARAARARDEWRWQVRNELALYDRLREHVVQYGRVNREVMAWGTSELVSIRSRFYRVINRRFQAQHFWPTFVSAKKTKQTDDEEQAVFRKRWFKARGAGGKAVDLVEVDISSSQTQILATFLGLKKLEDLSMGAQKRPFKEYLAEQAWRLSDKGELSFNSKYVKEPYTGPTDRRLIDLVKVTWMRVLYGSTPVMINADIEKDPAKYGPGWSEEAAYVFLREIPGYQTISEFFELCKKYAERSLRVAPARGIELVDPFDRAPVRWDPIYRNPKKIPAGTQKLMVGIPGVREKTGGVPKFFPADLTRELPVDLEKARKMIAPCLVHMLDASFSALVMRTLSQYRVSPVVGIHDAWLVPERVKCLSHGSTAAKVRKGEEVLREVIREVASEWYQQLEVVYRALFKLDPEEEYGSFVRDIWAAYTERRAAQNVPQFYAT